MANYFCIDVGGTFVKYGVITADGTVIFTGQCPTPHTDHAGFTAFLAQLIPDNVSGVAICFPGFIDGENGVCLSCGTLQWMADNYHIAEDLQKLTGLPVSVENDAHCALFAEMWQGRLKGVKNGAVMVLGTAVGMGLVLNGQLYTGSAGKAGEPGYNLHKEKMFWGYACSVPGLCADVAKAKGIEGELSGRQLMDMYQNGDETASDMVNSYMNGVAEGMFSIQNLLDLEIIAIGGGISANEIFMTALKAAFSDIYNRLPYQLHQPLITTCAANNNANLVGALYFHLQKYIK